MAQKRRKSRRLRMEKHRLRMLWLFAAVLLLLVAVLVSLRKDFRYYYVRYFTTESIGELSNTAEEARRINRITGLYKDKTFGIDFSHYQGGVKIDWENLSLMNGAVGIDFVVFRATMGTNGTDRNYLKYLQEVEGLDLIKGAYHYYRPNEDPVKQAEWFLKNCRLGEGDLLPVLDIEKMPRHKDPERLRAELKIWLDRVEEAYGQKPIIYTYYSFNKDYLRGYFDDYPLWLANYNDVPFPSDADDWKFWQFSEKGIVQGIPTKVDLNIFNGGSWGLRDYLLK